MPRYNIKYYKSDKQINNKDKENYTNVEKKEYNKLFDNIYDILNQCKHYRKTNMPNNVLEQIFYFEGYIKHPLNDSYLHNGNSPNRFSQFVTEMFLKEAGYTKEGPLWIKTIFH